MGLKSANRPVLQWVYVLRQNGKSWSSGLGLYLAKNPRGKEMAATCPEGRTGPCITSDLLNLISQTRLWLYIFNMFPGWFCWATRFGNNCSGGKNIKLMLTFLGSLVTLKQAFRTVRNHIVRNRHFGLTLHTSPLPHRN